MALNTQMGKHNPWNIDSNASSHMTSNVVLFHTCSPSSRNFLVQIVDRSLSKVVGIGFIAITDDLVPNFVLFVPNLTCNLLSIRKLRIFFFNMKKLFPTLFNNTNVKLSNMKRVNYPNMWETSHSFAIIHHDKWGLTRVRNILGAQWFVSFLLMTILE